MDIITTLRQYRLGPFTYFDTLGSFFIAYLIAPYLLKLLAKIGLHGDRAAIMWLVIPIAEITHIIIGRKTPLADMILDPSGGYFAKVIVLFMLVMGIRGFMR